MSENFDIPTLPVLPDEDPIAELLGTRVSEMSDEELDAYTKQMRTVIEAPQSLKALLRNHGSVETKAKKARQSTAKKLVDDLFGDL